MKYLILFLFPILVHGSVWDDTQKWNFELEEKYRNWIESERVRNNIFTHKKSPYNGMITDCADAIYNFRLIFSYENKLPFVINNPFKGKNKYISNKTKRFDKITDPNQRVIAFANYLRDILGTSSLAYRDTFPVSVHLISPGDTYVTRYSGYGQSYQHAYIVKSLRPTGDFVLYSSTVPAKVRKLAIQEGMPTPLFPKEPFGFRRFRWPEHLKTPIDKIPNEQGVGKEQYVMRKNYSGRNFYAKLREILKVTNPTVEGEVARLLRNITSKLESRLEVVIDAEKYKEEIGKRCFTSHEYDQYSTPSRDSRILGDIEELIELWKTAKRDQRTLFIKKKTALALDYLSEISQSRKAKRKLEKLLKLNIKNDYFSNTKFTNLFDFYFGMKDGKVSSHPNDTFAARWGLDNETRTKCPDYSDKAVITKDLNKTLCNAQVTPSQKLDLTKESLVTSFQEIEAKVLKLEGGKILFFKKNSSGSIELNVYQSIDDDLPIKLKIPHEHNQNPASFIKKYLNSSIISYYQEGPGSHGLNQLDCHTNAKGLVCNCL